VSWRADHDRHAIGLDGWEKMLAHPLGEFLLAPVEQDDMLATAMEDLGPGNHGVSVQARSGFSSHGTWRTSCD
jgi:hypothetical protein